MTTEVEKPLVVGAPGVDAAATRDAPGKVDDAHDDIVRTVPGPPAPPVAPVVAPVVIDVASIPRSRPGPDDAAR